MTLEHFDTILAFVLIITGVSLIITALNQMVSALLGLRGTHLRWGITTLLGNLDKNLLPHAREITDHVLHHPLISDSSFSGFKEEIFDRWRLANAIRKDELVEILRMLAKSPPGQADGQPPAWATALEKALDELNPQAANDAMVVAAEVQKLFPNDPAKAARLLAPLADAAAELPARIDKWFDSVMDRSSQRFSLHMRVWTVIFAVLLAFGLQLDAFRLFTRLSTDSELRSRVIAGAEAITQKADELLVTSTNAPPAVYALAMKQLLAEHTNELGGVTPVPLGFKSATEAQNWLAEELKRLNISDPDDQWNQRFLEKVPQANLQVAADRLNALVSDRLVVDLLPRPYPSPFYKNWSPKSRSFWGIFASAALLSLGAPFWFNALKNLSNLRPLLAKKEDAETKAAQTS